jgi:hypothetical protein
MVIVVVVVSVFVVVVVVVVVIVVVVVVAAVVMMLTMVVTIKTLIYVLCLYPETLPFTSRPFGHLRRLTRASIGRTDRAQKKCSMRSCNQSCSAPGKFMNATHIQGAFTRRLQALHPRCPNQSICPTSASDSGACAVCLALTPAQTSRRQLNPRRKRLQMSPCRVSIVWKKSRTILL